MLQRLFGLEAHGTSVRTEVLAGFTTFITMAYIVVVNPLVLGDAGMPVAGVAVATCVAAGFGSILMGLLSNYPLALAPGMGLNAYFTYTVVKGMGIPWQTALGCVFLSGCRGRASEPSTSTTGSAPERSATRICPCWRRSPIKLRLRWGRFAPSKMRGAPARRRTRRGGRSSP